MTHEQASQGTAILGVDLRTPVTVKTVNLPVDIAVKFLQNRQTSLIRLGGVDCAVYEVVPRPAFVVTVMEGVA